MSYLWRPRQEFSPGVAACDCIRCRSLAWRDLCNWAYRLRRRWVGRTVCVARGHLPYDARLSWKTGCQRCGKKATTREPAVSLRRHSNGRWDLIVLTEHSGINLFLSDANEALLGAFYTEHVWRLAS